MKRGTVMSYLKHSGSVANRVQLMADACTGLQYLHRLNIVHGDIKGANILVNELDSDGNAKAKVVACLCDFGLAGLDPAFRTPTYSNVDSPTRRAIYSVQSDVYSFSMTMWQIFSASTPFHECTNPGHIVLSITKGLRPSQRALSYAMDVGLTDDIWSLMEECWVSDPTDRPSASHILGCLEQAIRSTDTQSTPAQS
ncbi:hypothetical protein CERSUDRAFT_119236 [Gelatoporia subvermispora B]|uniref:Protein kinase domain-containing protein n=1 Tax=Ceriporiopsis subvermispora (strain B) TaxID=914234 RepID=M2QZF3_CERS8|nr:hypothetical protein CERSUDRAFT_119236 [Gelatoporia subvermispora B]